MTINDDWEPTDDDAPDAPPKRAHRRLRAVPDVVDLDGPRKIGGEWRAMLRINQHKQPTKDPGNLVVMLAHDPVWAGKLAWNAFSERIVWTSQPEPMQGFPTPTVGELDETDYVFVQHWFALYRGVSFAREALRPAMRAAARQQTFHPVADWLRSLRWDGQRRVDTWLRTYLHANDEPHVDLVGRWWLISAVARVMSPGCQADHVLILEGPQGVGKSSAARILGGEWHLPSLPDVRDATRAASALRGRWTCEIGELDALKGASLTRTKDFTTLRSDVYRGAYAELELERLRQCVFIGTTNERVYLGDATGGRRWWPVYIPRLIDREALSRDREQLFAEALALYEAGASWHPDASAIPALTEAQDKRYQADEWEVRVAEWANRPSPREGFTIGDALAGAIGLSPERWDRPAQTRMGNVLTRLGFHAHQVREGTLRVRRYWPQGSLRLKADR